MSESPQGDRPRAPDSTSTSTVEGRTGAGSTSPQSGLVPPPATELGPASVADPSSSPIHARGADSPMLSFEGPTPSVFGRMPLSNSFVIGDRCITVVARFDHPEIVLFADVLTEAECLDLISLSSDRLIRSATVSQVSGKSNINGNRTSVGTLFRRGENGLVDGIDATISRLLCWPATHFEDMHVVRYQVGEEFKPHFDFFRPEHPGSAERLANGGQRVGTMILYLNDAKDGGETVFPQIGLSVIPRMGSAVYFANIGSNNMLNTMLLHSGAPVLRGEKWIATKWLRQHRCYGA